MPGKICCKHLISDRNNFDILEMYLSMLYALGPLDAQMRLSYCYESVVVIVPYMQKTTKYSIYG